MQTQNQQKKKAGVFGWLGVLVFAMLVLWPLMLMIEIRNTLLTAALDFPQLQDRYIWYYFRTATFFVVLSCVAISMIGGAVLMKRRKRSSVYIAIATLWLSGPVGQIVSFVLPFIMYKLGSFSGNIAMHMNALITSIVFKAACTAYLLLSKRVKLTYPKDSEPDPEETDD